MSEYTPDSPSAGKGKGLSKNQNAPESLDTIAADREDYQMKNAMYVNLARCVSIHLIDGNRRESVRSIAATNPGDGTKRVYGETTFIANGSDIDGVHPDAVHHTRKVDAQPGMQGVSGNEEPFTYLEDTEARG